MQLVLPSKSDHGPYMVSIDGQPGKRGNSFSADAECGIAWSSGALEWGNHTVVGEALLDSDIGSVFEILGIVCVNATPTAAFYVNCRRTDTTTQSPQPHPHPRRHRCRRRHHHAQAQL